MKPSTIKANGIHYTPPELAEFFATVTAARVKPGPLRVLDPACGDGALLVAFANAIQPALRSQLTLVGYDTSPLALAKASDKLSSVEAQAVELIDQDFLEIAGNTPRQRSFLDNLAVVSRPSFDVIISNPPYVRTQVLGSQRAQSLAKDFGLTGRVDLYHAFTMAMANVLKSDGVLGLLTSNRFLSIKSGAKLRQLLTAEFELKVIYDLGDTKLFSAAVLPVILVAQKTRPVEEPTCSFDRIYERRAANHGEMPNAASVLAAVRSGI